mmetsp:Transcript_20231/g.35972  ORF Transcript_20231/g.35972 Transcript_20231/m.35972 type:complete len:774 (-) Transcript_20231:96-2417(-)
MATASPPPPPPKVQKTTFTFKTDLRKSQLDCHPCCGILHALRSSPNREEQSFAWIDNYSTIGTACGHLERYGFLRDNKVQSFLPYSSKAAWVTKYPHAFPYVHCDEEGGVTGFPHWSPHAQSALDIPLEVVHGASQPSTTDGIARSSAAAANGAVGKGRVAAMMAAASKKKGGNGNRLPNSLLSNNERHQLHLEIYNYFSWLTDQVTDLETSEVGRRSVKKADLPAAGLRGLLVKLETTFKVVGQKKIAASNDNDMGDNDATDDTPVPLLEESLLHEMSNLAALEEETRKKNKAKIKAESTLKKNSSGEALDFDSMYEKLVAYKEEHGHPNVPVKYQKDVQLGSWVSGLRTKKKAYDKDGDVMDLEDEGWSLDNEEEVVKEEVVANNDTTNNDSNTPTTPIANQKYLNTERISRLESLGFSWSMAKPKAKPKSWDERLDELKQWREDHGTYKVPRGESLGEWLHNQRTLYGKRDTKFMTKKAPRLEEIGYTFDVRENNSVSWDDRFQQLVEYHQEHGNFEVPWPVSEEDDGIGDGDVGNSDETVEKYKFYKWVARLHNEYRAYEKGTHSKLNAERVDKLKNVNFQFKGPKSRGRPSTSNYALVPKISWEKRIQQLESFKADTGHLDIDHNYKHCSNLGGWAAETSTLYKNWKEGSQQLSEDMIAKFNQLIGLGFKFDVSSYYENNRSWEDHYAVLLKFKEGNNGSARVPLKYKADLRLGKWVQTQRQQYKLLQDGSKKSKLSEDRIERLEGAGFEWEVAGGGNQDEEEDDDQE